MFGAGDGGVRGGRAYVYRGSVVGGVRGGGTGAKALRAGYALLWAGELYLVPNAHIILLKSVVSVLATRKSSMSLRDLS